MIEPCINYTLLGSFNEVDLPFYCLIMIHRTSDGRGCANVGIEQEVQFDVTVTMDQCLMDIQTIRNIG